MENKINIFNSSTEQVQSQHRVIYLFNFNNKTIFRCQVSFVSLEKYRDNTISPIGIKETSLDILFLYFTNVYADKIYNYPKTLLRNLIGYQYYSLKNNISFPKIISNPQNIAIKLLGLLTLPLSFIYHKIK